MEQGGKDKPATEKIALADAKGGDGKGKDAKTKKVVIEKRFRSREDDQLREQSQFTLTNSAANSI